MEFRLVVVPESGRGLIEDARLAALLRVDIEELDDAVVEQTYADSDLPAGLLARIPLEKAKALIGVLWLWPARRSARSPRLQLSHPAPTRYRRRRCPGQGSDNSWPRTCPL